MATARVLAKGQIVIPKEIRDKMNIVPGDKVEVKVIEQGILIFPSNKSYTDLYKGVVKGALSLTDLEELHAQKA